VVKHHFVYVLLLEQRLCAPSMAHEVFEADQDQVRRCLGHMVWTGIPLSSAEAKVHKYGFLDKHLRLDNEYGFPRAGAKRTPRGLRGDLLDADGQVRRGESARTCDRTRGAALVRWLPPERRRGYASDPLSQRPLVWLMEKPGALGLAYRDKVEIDAAETALAINESYREFGRGLYHFFSKRFYRSVRFAPKKGTAATTSRINEIIDRSVFDRWRSDATYRPESEWPRGARQIRLLSVILNPMSSDNGEIVGSLAKHFAES
jgi:hypothetical protein